jgi:hypothetical protein
LFNSFSLLYNYWPWKENVLYVSYSLLLLLVIFRLFSDFSFAAAQIEFCIGFEFEEISHLVVGAEDYSVQKVPIFSFHYNDRLLWHVEIDGKNIEFVVNHFPRSDIALVHQSMVHIKYAIDQLNVLFLTNKERGVSFREWVNSLKALFIPKTIMEETALNTLDEKRTCLLIQETGSFPCFKPQVTIQLPLNRLVDLCFNLFCNDFLQLPYFLQSLPYANIEDLYQVRTYKGGLFFLQSLTMGRMSDPTVESCVDLIGRGFSQFDVKRLLPIMSRRPFSLMCQELEQRQELHRSDYVEEFMGAMSFNKLFATVPSTFGQADYGEQFLVSGRPSDLKGLNTLIYGKKRVPIRLEKDDSPLLSEGIISTTFLKRIFPNFAEITSYEQVIASIVTPCPRPVFNPERDGLTLTVTEDSDYHFDLLSPPVLLCHNNGHERVPHRDCDSMGALQDGDLDGDCIVEFRRIQGAEHLRKFPDRDFLCTTENIVDESTRLFEEVIRILDCSDDITQNRVIVAANELCKENELGDLDRLGTVDKSSDSS